MDALSQNADSLADRSSNGLHRFGRDKIQDGGPFSRKPQERFRRLG